VTTRRSLERFVARCEGARGVRAARRALPLVAEGALSPPEAKTALLAALSTRRGGYGCGMPLINCSPDGQSRVSELVEAADSGRGVGSYVCDLLWPERGVALEYQGREAHGTERLVRDAVRQVRLGAAGIDVVPLTPEQLKVALDSSANAAALHHASRIENGSFRLDTAFFDAVMISRTLTAAKLAGFGLKTSQFRVLAALRILGPGATASQGASYLFLRSSDVTAPLKALEERGLVSKERNADNRRTKALALTDQGYELVEELAPIVYDALLETCRSDEAAVQLHLQAARDVVARDSLRLRLAALAVPRGAGALGNSRVSVAGLARSNH